MCGSAVTAGFLRGISRSVFIGNVFLVSIFLLRAVRPGIVVHCFVIDGRHARRIVSKLVPGWETELVPGWEFSFVSKIDGCVISTGRQLHGSTDPVPHPSLSSIMHDRLLKRIELSVITLFLTNSIELCIVRQQCD